MCRGVLHTERHQRRVQRHRHECADRQPTRVPSTSAAIAMTPDGKCPNASRSEVGLRSVGLIKSILAPAHETAVRSQCRSRSVRSLANFVSVIQSAQRWASTSARQRRMQRHVQAVIDARLLGRQPFDSAEQPVGGGRVAAVGAGAAGHIGAATMLSCGSPSTITRWSPTPSSGCGQSGAQDGSMRVMWSMTIRSRPPDFRSS